MSEAELIALLREKQESGLQECISRYGPLLRYVIAPILPDPQDREECFSDVTALIWEKAETFDPRRGSWKAWLTAIARNTAVNRARANQRQATELLLSPDLPSEDDTPEERMIQAERRAALQMALNRLPAKDRALFYRKYVTV